MEINYSIQFKGEENEPYAVFCVQEHLEVLRKLLVENKEPLVCRVWPQNMNVSVLMELGTECMFEFFTLGYVSPTFYSLYLNQRKCWMVKPLVELKPNDLDEVFMPWRIMHCFPIEKKHEDQIRLMEKASKSRRVVLDVGYATSFALRDWKARNSSAPIHIIW
jgi:hypothetical protein